MPSSRTAGLALALLLAAAPAARAQDAAKPAPLAPFDGARCKALAEDPERKPAERVAALFGILDARLAEWKGVAGGTRTADPARDDRGREIALVVACAVPALQEQVADGSAGTAPPEPPAAVKGNAALEPWWDLACLLAGARADVPDGVTAVLSAEKDPNLLTMALRAMEGRFPPAALAPVLHLLDHPHAVRGAAGVDVYPVRVAAARVLSSLGLRFSAPPGDEPPDALAEDLTALCRKWLHSDVEAEWRGALAVVKDRGTDVLVAAASIEMGVKGIPLEKLAAISEVLDMVDARAAGEGK